MVQDTPMGSVQSGWLFFWIFPNSPADASSSTLQPITSCGPLWTPLNSYKFLSQSDSTCDRVQSVAKATVGRDSTEAVHHSRMVMTRSPHSRPWPHRQRSVSTLERYHRWT